MTTPLWSGQTDRQTVTHKSPLATCTGGLNNQKFKKNCLTIGQILLSMCTLLIYNSNG